MDETVPDLYNYTLIVFDKYSNWLNDTVLVTVNSDVYSPVLSSPADLTIDEGTSGNTISWTVNDINPSHYQTFINGTANVTDTWVGTVLLISIDGLELGIYEIELYAIDLYGNSANDTVIVTIRDVTSPTISSPEDVIYEYGGQGHTIHWTLYDIHPYQYWVSRNDSIVQAAGWSSGVLSYSIDGLSVGKYNITLSVTDTSGNMATNAVRVTVVDIYAPEIDHPLDIEYEAGSTGHAITWNASDVDPHSYDVIVNGTVNITSSWDGSAIVFNIDGFTLGVYNITVIVYDSTSNSAVDTVWVTVVDTTPPDISHPPDVSFVEGESGHYIMWTTYDLHLSNYELHRNGTAIKSGLWNSSEEVVTVLLDAVPRTCMDGGQLSADWLVGWNQSHRISEDLFVVCHRRGHLHWHHPSSQVIQVSGLVGGLQKQSNYFGYCLRLSHLVAVRTIVLVGRHPPCFRGGAYWRGHWTEESRCREQEVARQEDMGQVPTSLPSG